MSNRVTVQSTRALLQRAIATRADVPWQARAMKQNSTKPVLVGNR